MKWQHELQKKQLEWTWQETAWESDDNGGGSVKITISDVIKYLSTQEEIDLNIEELIKVTGNPGGAPDWKYDLARVKRAELKHPIIIAKYHQRCQYILDGNHRLQKAVNLGIETIKAKILNLDEDGHAPERFKRMFFHGYSEE